MLSALFAAIGGGSDQAESSRSRAWRGVCNGGTCPARDSSTCLSRALWRRGSRARHVTQGSRDQGQDT
eukprot:2548095-Rhodomonas_salina.1